MIPIRQPSRRDVIVAAGAATASRAFLQPTRPAVARDHQEGASHPGKLLILGGTRFLGPVIVRAALKAGWEVTLFNRGRSNPDLFSDLDLRVGDRNTSDYRSLATGRWDLVIDTSCYIPGHVTAAIAALGDRARHYLVVSTLSVYSEPKEGSGPRELDESSAVARLEPALLAEFKEINDVGKYGSRYYGALKALCEQAAEAAMPSRVTVVRPGLIVGPEDGSGRFTYWPVRIAEGGRILAPGDPEALVQYVDVRDLGAFTFDVGARRVGRVINAVGFDGPVTTREMLVSCVVEGDGPRSPRTSSGWTTTSSWTRGWPLGWDSLSGSREAEAPIRTRWPGKKVYGSGHWPRQHPRRWRGTGRHTMPTTGGERESRARRRPRFSRHGTRVERPLSPPHREWAMAAITPARSRRQATTAREIFTHE